MSMRIKTAIVIVLIIFAITTAHYASSLFFTRKNIVATMENDQARLIDIADDLIVTKIELLKTYAENVAKKLLDARSENEWPGIMKAQLQEFPDFMAFTVFSREGVKASLGDSPAKNYAGTHSYLSAAFDGTSYISTSFADPFTGELVFYLYLKMNDDMVLAVTIPGMYFVDILSEYRLWKTGSIYLIDSDGTFIGHYNQERIKNRMNYIELAKTDTELQSVGAFIEKMISSHESTGNTGTYYLSGQQRLCSYKHISSPMVNWVVAAVAPFDESPEANVQQGLFYSAFFFGIVGIIVAIFVSRLVALPFYKIEAQNRNLEELNKTVRAQAELILSEHKHTKLLLDATPLACILWSRDVKLIECNAACLKLFKMKDREDVANHIFDLVPEYQSDGGKSQDRILRMVEEGFDEGFSSDEFDLRLLDGTPLPVELTFVRVKYGDETVLAGYARDLREQRRMMGEIERRDNLFNTVNQAATVLLQSENGEFENALRHCMEMIGVAVDADRVCIWRNRVEEGRLYCSPIYEWPGAAGSQPGVSITADISYDRDIPGWEETLSQGKCINKVVRDMSPEERAHLSPREALSVFVVPVFVRDQFWGFVSVDECHLEEVFSKDAESALRSGGLLIANALLRNEMTLSLKTAASSLEIALNEAQAANSAKSSFLARMSHEIRTPLNAVIGLSELTIKSGGLNEEARTNLEKIYASGAMLLSIVNDILDISKIEAGKLELIPVEYDIPSLINDTVTQSIMRLEEKPVEFVLNIDKNLPTLLYGDDLRIKQIINNLLSNAFKYTRKGKVEFGVSCEREGDTDTVWMTIFVRDTGIGIRREDMGRLFENYVKMDTKANRAVDGIGLGLPIVKMLVELMGGRITVESEYGKGSTFTAKFRQKFVNGDIIGQEIAQNLKQLKYTDRKRVGNAQLTRIRLPYARVLVVDDNATNLDVTKGMMQTYGMQIDCVSSGQKAVDAVANERVRYNAIFMDHMMPGMDGIEATRIIREEIGTEYARTVPIIALTANAITGNKEMFLNSGFQAFIPKPIELAQLDAVIRQWVRDRNHKNTSDDPQNNGDNEVFTERRGGNDRRGRKKPVRKIGKRAAGDEKSEHDGRLAGHVVPGLNISDGLARFGGDEKIYRQVLRSYVTNTRLILETVKEIKEDNLDDYIFAVHGIKASSRGIGAESVGASAEALEKTARSEDINFLRANHPAFLVEAEELMLAIEHLLNKISTEKPRKDKPDAEVLSRIAAACEKYDIDALDAAMAELEACEYESGTDIVVWLRENVDRMNYEEIVGKLSSMVK